MIGLKLVEAPEPMKIKKITPLLRSDLVAVCGIFTTRFLPNKKFKVYSCLTNMI